MRLFSISLSSLMCIYLSVCSNKVSSNSFPKANIKELPTIEKLLSRTHHSVEDTIHFEIGGKLYFGGRDEPPTDSITVIEAYHSPQTSYRQYEFIVHNKNTPCHQYFTTEFLKKTIDPNFIEEISNFGFFDYNEYESYQKRLEEQKTLINKQNIDPRISEYEGFWIYLKEYKGEYYIEDLNQFCHYFRIKDNIYHRFYMDGPMPYAVESFKIEKNGDFSLKPVNEESELYQLVNRKNHVYKRLDGSDTYVTPVKYANRFETIEHCNNELMKMD